jgi:hypothetical protein
MPANMSVAAPFSTGLASGKSVVGLPPMATRIVKN